MNWKKLLAVTVRVIVIAFFLWFAYDSTRIALDYEEQKYRHFDNGVTE